MLVLTLSDIMELICFFFLTSSESKDATFTPIPVKHKPISSVLEKIRKRKLEISKKSVVVDI